jgi:hypothetical protein
MLRIYLAAALLIAWSASLLFLGREWGRADGADRATKLLSKQMDAVLAEREADRKAREKLQRTLDRLPRSQGVIREVVRENPSGCVLPPAVVDGLREAIRKANASRALPADS